MMNREQQQVLLDAWVARIRATEPRAIAVLCHGSYARAQPEPYSDLDLDILYDDDPPIWYRSAFDTMADGRTLHVTIASYTLAGWLEQFESPEESEAWAFYLPARQMARLLWATPAAEAQLHDRLIVELAGSPQLQDLLESAAKVQNAMLRQDELGLRLAAQDLGLRCPALVGLLNPPVLVDTRRDALQAALDMPNVPEGYRADLLCCLGLQGQATSMADVHAASVRLIFAILAMLRQHRDLLVDRVEPGLPEALDSGLLDAMLR